MNNDIVRIWLSNWKCGDSREANELGVDQKWFHKFKERCEQDKPKNQAEKLFMSGITIDQIFTDHLLLSQYQFLIYSLRSQIKKESVDFNITLPESKRTPKGTLTKKIKFVENKKVEEKQQINEQDEQFDYTCIVDKIKSGIVKSNKEITGFINNLKDITASATSDINAVMDEFDDVTGVVDDLNNKGVASYDVVLFYEACKDASILAIQERMENKIASLMKQMEIDVDIAEVKQKISKIKEIKSIDEEKQEQKINIIKQKTLKIIIFADYGNNGFKKAMEAKTKMLSDKYSIEVRLVPKTMGNVVVPSKSDIAIAITDSLSHSIESSIKTQCEKHEIKFVRSCATYEGKPEAIKESIERLILDLSSVQQPTAIADTIAELRHE